MNSKICWSSLFLSMAVLFSSGRFADAASTVYVNFGPGDPLAGAPGFAGNLTTLTTGLGIAPLTPGPGGEIEALTTTILDELFRIYVADGGFDVTFIPTFGPTHPPIAHNVIDFTRDLSTSNILTPADSLPLGVADSDWLNRQFFPPPRTFQTAEVFPQAFGTMVDEWVGSIPGARPAMIGELGTALGSTAAHELGHTYGLQHHDSYGNPLIGPAGAFGPMGEYIIVDTDGLQNSHIMATGPTGIVEMERETARTLSRYSKAKLELTGDPSVTPATDSLVSTPFTHTLEVPHPHGDFVDAQELFGTPLPISGLHAANVHGASLGGLMGGGTSSDFYKVELSEAGLVTAEVLSVGVYGPYIETVLEVYDESMDLIFASDDLDYSTTMMFFTKTVPFGDPEGKQDDPMLMNMPLDAGTYFFHVTIDLDGEHAADPVSTELYYDLFITSESSFAAVPEPASFVILLGMLACSWLSICIKRSR